MVFPCDSLNYIGNGKNANLEFAEGAYLLLMIKQKLLYFKIFSFYLITDTSHKTDPLTKNRGTEISAYEFIFGTLSDNIANKNHLNIFFTMST